MKSITLYPLVKSAIDNGWDVFQNWNSIKKWEKYELSFLSQSWETYASIGWVSIITENDNITYLWYKDFLFSKQFLLSAVWPYCWKTWNDLDDYIYELSHLIQRDLEAWYINQTIDNINSLFLLRQ